MSYTTLFQAIKAKYLAPNAPKPLRTKMPMRLSQDSAVDVSITPLVLAEEAGSLCKLDLAGNHKVVMTGAFSLFGVDYYHAYVSESGDKPAFIHFGVQKGQTLETRLYRAYAEEIPATQEEWAFWLNEVPVLGVEFVPGYIGESIMQSLNADLDPTTGKPYQYQRTWGAGNQHVPPIVAIETLVDATGATTTVRHRMMHYRRALTDPSLYEYLLVSAVETDFGASVNFWLGIDVAPSDLTVFAAADAPI